MQTFRPFWTPERNAQLRLLAATHTATAIAREIGITPRAAQGQCHRLGISLGGKNGNQHKNTKQREAVRTYHAQRRAEIAAAETARVERMMRIVDSLYRKGRAA